MLPFKGLCIEGDVRLVDGVREYDGRIEVCYNGEWGVVCDNHMNDSVAEVVCRQLGFSLHGMAAYYYITMHSVTFRRIISHITIKTLCIFILSNRDR